MLSFHHAVYWNLSSVFIVYVYAKSVYFLLYEIKAMFHVKYTVSCCHLQFKLGMQFVESVYCVSCYGVR